MVHKIKQLEKSGKGLSSEEIKEWYQLEELVSIVDSYGLYDLKRRAQLERKMNDRQAGILESYFDAPDYGISVKSALKRAHKDLLKTVK